MSPSPETPRGPEKLYVVVWPDGVRTYTSRENAESIAQHYASVRIVECIAASPSSLVEEPAETPASEHEQFVKALAGKSADELRALLAQEWVDAGQRYVTECQDCGLAYGGDGWIECVVERDVWHQISPSGDDSGILCITCMARRLKRLGLKDVPVMLCGTEAIRVADQRESFNRGWDTAKHALSSLASAHAVASPSPDTR